MVGVAPGLVRRADSAGCGFLDLVGFFFLGRFAGVNIFVVCLVLRSCINMYILEWFMNLQLRNQV